MSYNILFKITNPGLNTAVRSSKYACWLQCLYMYAHTYAGQHMKLSWYIGGGESVSGGTLEIPLGSKLPQEEWIRIHPFRILFIQQHWQAGKSVPLHTELLYINNKVSLRWLGTNHFSFQSIGLNNAKLNTRIAEDNENMEETVGYYSCESAQLIDSKFKG